MYKVYSDLFRKLRIVRRRYVGVDKLATIYQLIEIAEMEIKDEKAKQAGFMIGLSGELYTKSLGKNSAVYIENTNNQWEAWRETYIQGKSIPISYKVIASFKEFEYVLLKAKRYFDYIQRKRDGKR